MDRADSFPLVDFGRGDERPDAAISDLFSPAPRFSGKLQHLMDFILDSYLSDKRVL